MPYSRVQFETAYSATVQMLHGLRYIDTPEIIRWVRDLTNAQADKAPGGSEQADPALVLNAARLVEILEAVHALRETLKVKGIPPLPKYRAPAPAPKGANGQVGTAN
jgi:hypothetical protein